MYIAEYSGTAAGRDKHGNEAVGPKYRGALSPMGQLPAAGLPEPAEAAGQSPGLH